MTSREYAERIAHARIEPVGSDAILWQIAVAFHGKDAEKAIVLSQDGIEQSPEQIYQLLQALSDGDNRKS